MKLSSFNHQSGQQMSVNQFYMPTMLLVEKLFMIKRLIFIIAFLAFQTGWAQEEITPSPRDRFNIPYPKPEITLKSGNLTDNSAIEVRGL